MIYLLASLICYFTPPPEWEFRLPVNKDPYVQAVFVGQGKGLLAPCIRYTVEETDRSLKEYVQSVRELQAAQAQQAKDRWVDLGDFQTKAGKGRLIEIELISEVGHLQMLQVICVGDGRAHILTAIALKEEFASVRSTFLEALRSLTFADSLFAPIVDLEKRERLERVFASLGEFPEEGDRATIQAERWESLQKLVANSCAPQGEYLQLLLLKEGYGRIYQ